MPTTVADIRAKISVDGAQKALGGLELARSDDW
jgi:hypothetical protein